MGIYQIAQRLKRATRCAECGTRSTHYENRTDPFPGFMNRQLIKAFLIAGILVSSGCTSKLEYNSHPDADGLRALRNKAVLSLQCEYKNDVLIDAQPLEESLGEEFAEQQKASFMSQFRSFVALRDTSREVADRYGK